MSPSLIPINCPARNLSMVATLEPTFFSKYKGHLDFLLECNQPLTEVNFKLLITLLKIPTLGATLEHTLA